MRKTIYSIFVLTALAFGVMVGTAAAQQLIYQEGFNDDGEAANPQRYTTTGRDVWELDRIFGNPPLASASSQRGPIYCAHNFEVSFVGIPNIPDLRMIFTLMLRDAFSNLTLA